MRHIFAVIGGDMRLTLLASALSRQGHGTVRLAGETASAAEIAEAVRGADCAILPLPLSVREGRLNAPLASSPAELAEVFAGLRGVPLVCAGRVDEASRALAHEAGIGIEDYYEREELAVMNAAATAEGAVMLAMQETAGTLCGERVLVTGFGRIGKLLALRLRALGAEVTAAARSAADRAWAEAFGCRAADISALGSIRGCGVVFNTVPARVFTERVLTAMEPDTLLIDLASRPGGVDFEAASRLDRRVVWALSLPGEAAPEAAGAAIGRAVMNILAERGRGA